MDKYEERNMNVDAFERKNETEVIDDIENDVAYEKMHEYCMSRISEFNKAEKEEGEGKKITTESLQKDTGLSETTIHKFRRGDKISLHSFQCLNQVFYELFDGENLYDYYRREVHRMASEGELLCSKCTVTISGNKYQIQPQGFERLLKDKGINKELFFVAKLFGLNMNIIEVEKGTLKENKLNTMTKIYAYFVKDNEYKKTCVYHGEIENAYRKFPDKLYIHINDNVSLKFTDTDREMEKEWETIGKFVKCLHTVDNFNRKAEDIELYLDYMKKEEVLDFLFKNNQNEYIVLDD